MGTLCSELQKYGGAAAKKSTALFAEALAWMGRIGCTGVDALALPGARATKNFFEENGFTARLLVVHRPL